MAASFSSLLLSLSLSLHLLLLLLCYQHQPAAAAADAKTTNHRQQQHYSLVLQSTCNSTTYYDLCLATLAADPSSSTADVRGLCAIALSAAAANASASASALATNATTAAAAADPDRAALLRACAAKYTDAREALGAAQSALGEGDYDYAFVHVSAAAEYPGVCRALFRRRQRVAYKYTADLARRDEGLRRLCTVALDIISLLLDHGLIN